MSFKSLDPVAEFTLSGRVVFRQYREWAEFQGQNGGTVPAGKCVDLCVLTQKMNRQSGEFEPRVVVVQFKGELLKKAPESVEFGAWCAVDLEYGKYGGKEFFNGLEYRLTDEQGNVLKPAAK